MRQVAVICAGTASRAMASMLGDHVNVYPVKGYSITGGRWPGARGVL